jgi:hypothetical protein
MKRKTNPAQVSTSQLELPLGQQATQETVRNLSYYIGLGKVFATYHKHWPTVESTREQFRAARVHGYDGQRIDRELRFPAPSLEADPAYQSLRERCLADGMTDGVNLAALDPRYRTVLQEDDIAALFDTIVLPRPGDPGAVRYATGVPAHRPGELTLHIGDAIGAQALRLADLDPDDPRVAAAGFSVRVQASDELKDFIDRVGARGPAAAAYKHLEHLEHLERLADDYLLEAADGGRLFLGFQLRSGRRYAGKFAVERLTRKLAAVYRADPVLAGLCATAPPDRPAAPTIPAAPAPYSDEELREQLAALEPEGRSLNLPIQQLSRFADIRRALEQAGGVFSTHRQRFDFEEGTDPALVVERLLSAAAR